MSKLRSALAVAVVAVFLSAPALPKAAAAPSPGASAPAPVFASAAEYWNGFVDFWGGSLKKQNGIVLLVLGLGAVSLFIITRSKSKK